MRKETTANRIKTVMREQGLKQVDILRMAQPYCEQYGVKLGRNDLSQYVNGKVEPGQEKLAILGLTLQVSEAWLMGYDVARGRQKPAEKTSAPTFDDFTYAMQNETRDLTDLDKQLLLSMAKQLNDARKAKNGDSE